ncbi:MAG: hypothetical protein AAFU61_13575, partial [Pseudomonadota bacterium]
ACLADVLALEQAGLLRPASDFALSVMRERAEAGEAEALGELRFLHDRVREAAHAGLAAPDREVLHLALGRRRLAAGPLSPEAGQAAADHLNRAADRLTDPAERSRLADLNLAAGLRARRAAAFDAARHYFECGLALPRPGGSDAAARARGIALRLGLAEARHLQGETAAAEAMCADVLAEADTDEERLRVHALRITLLTSQSRHAEALDEGVAASRLLGAPLARRPGKPGVIREVLAARLRLRGLHTDEIAALPEMDDPAALARQSLYASLAAPAFLSDPDFAIVVALKTFNAALRGGLSPESPFGVMIYAVANAAMGRYAEAARFGALALELDARLGDARRSPMLRFVHATAIGHWHAHARDNLDRLAEAYDGALQVGDVVYADYALVTAGVDGFFLGEPLERTARRARRHLDFISARKGLGPLDSTQAVSSLIIARAAACLAGEAMPATDLSGPDATEAQIVEALPDSLARFGYAVAKMQLRVIFDDLEEEPPEAQTAARALPDVKVMADIRLAEQPFYDGLAAARRHDREPGALARAGLRRRAGRALRRIAPWAEACAANYEARRALLAAEVARINGRDSDATDFYETAIAEAAEAGCLHVEALAHELAGRHALTRGRRRIAAMNLREAVQVYSAWGASAKVERLEAEHAALLEDQAEPAGATR